MAAFLSKSSGTLGEINTTPLIDVMLVMLVMFIITIPPALNSVEVELPSGPPPPSDLPLPDRNVILLTGKGQLLWNGHAKSEAELAALLAVTRKMKPEPELQFQPEAYASYDQSARTLAIIKRAKVTKFGFVGNERYRDFGKPVAMR